jgi:hypothetical protein
MDWRRVAIVAVAAPLAGCADDWWKADESVAYVPPAVYCYRSLADVDCYAQPFDRDRRRLVGYVGPWPGYGPPPPPPPAASGCGEARAADLAMAAAEGSCPGGGT